jgi:hypothetical protein
LRCWDWCLGAGTGGGWFGDAMSSVVKLGIAEYEVNAEAVELVEQVLARLRSGHAVAVAFVEVGRGGVVATGWCESNEYHRLNSGAARLANRLAAVPDEPA